MIFMEYKIAPWKKKVPHIMPLLIQPLNIKWSPFSMVHNNNKILNNNHTQSKENILAAVYNLFGNLVP